MRLLFALCGTTGVLATGVVAYLNKRNPSTLCTSIFAKSNIDISTKKLPWDFNWDYANGNDKNDTTDGTPPYPNIRRNIVLIRHGQYNYADEPSQRTLTTLGKVQADCTGKRLKEMNLPFDCIISSTMIRAQETTEAISKYFPNVEITEDAYICEGPVFPAEPPFHNYDCTPYEYYETHGRVETAFRKYFHRSASNVKKSEYLLVVCHANVIRYLVCRALQLPPECWSRFNLDNASITWISIAPDGRVCCRMMGNSGHISSDRCTSS